MASAYVPRPLNVNTSITRYLSEELRRIAAAILTTVQTCNGQAPLLTYTVATLPTGKNGSVANVSDGTAALAWGATVTGGGSTSYLVRYNGTNWTVVGK